MIVLSKTEQRALAGGNRTFPSQLTFSRKDVVTFRQDAVTRMSISGVQDKISLKLVRGNLLPTDHDGEYILKPIPSAVIPFYASDVPANEHLTMQIAQRVFGIATPPNACLPLSDGELAYIVKRFDRRDGQKLRQEDFCQLSSRTEATRGRNYKYDGSYEEAGRILKQYCKAYRAEIEKLFERIVFCYAFSNGDAHFKNFSLIETGWGDFVLTPAYDLLATALHFPQESALALDLFDDFESEAYSTLGFYSAADFFELARRFGIEAAHAKVLLVRFSERKEKVVVMIRASLLSEAAKSEYEQRFLERLKAINNGLHVAS
ncbi:MAG: HipA domain-containing protein [bacterium]